MMGPQQDRYPIRQASEFVTDAKGGQVWTVYWTIRCARCGMVADRFSENDNPAPSHCSTTCARAMQRRRAKERARTDVDLSAPPPPVRRKSRPATRRGPATWAELEAWLLDGGCTITRLGSGHRGVVWEGRRVAVLPSTASAAASLPNAVADIRRATTLTLRRTS